MISIEINIPGSSTYNSLIPGNREFKETLVIDFIDSNIYLKAHISFTVPPQSFLSRFQVQNKPHFSLALKVILIPKLLVSFCKTIKS